MKDFEKQLTDQINTWYKEFFGEKTKISKEQKQLHQYIANRFNCEVLDKFRRDHQGKLKFKTLSYSTYDKTTGEEDNRYQPRQVQRKLNELHQDGYEIAWCFNTEKKIEIILSKEVGKMTPKERAQAEIKERNKQLRERGFTYGFNQFM